MRRRQMHPHMSLRKSSVNPWRKPSGRKQCVFCFAVVCFFVSPIESESVESHIILGNKIWALSSEKPE